MRSIAETSKCFDGCWNRVAVTISLELSLDNSFRVSQRLFCGYRVKSTLDELFLKL